jgi:hypothetical protein
MSVAEAIAAGGRPVREAPEATPAQALVAGAVGRLGEAVLTAILGRGGYCAVHVLTRGELVSSEALLRAWPAGGAGLDEPFLGFPPARDAFLIYEHQRLYNERDAGLHQLNPAQVLTHAALLAAAGVRRLMIVLPLTATEQLSRTLLELSALRIELARLDFARVDLIHPTLSESGPDLAAGWLERLRRFYFSQLRFMLPGGLQALTSQQIARVCMAILALPATGVRVHGAAALHAELARIDAEQRRAR